VPLFAVEPLKRPVYDIRQPDYQMDLLSVPLSTVISHNRQYIRQPDYQMDPMSVPLFAIEPIKRPVYQTARLSDGSLECASVRSCIPQ
jgi:hypothetical protein